MALTVFLLKMTVWVAVLLVGEELVIGVVIEM